MTKFEEQLVLEIARIMQPVTKGFAVDIVLEVILSWLIFTAGETVF